MMPKKENGHSTGHRHAFVLPDFPALKSAVSVFLAVLLAGVVLHKSTALVRQEGYPDATAHNASATGDDPTPVWKHLSSHGDVELLRRPIRGSKLYAHRAVATVDLPIEAILHVFRDTPNNVDWAKDMAEAEEYHKSGVHRKKGNTRLQTSIVRQRYKVPLPGISDREFLMSKKTIAIENRDGSHSSVTYDFESIDDREPDIKVCDGCVRGVNLGTLWAFTSLDEGKRTKVQVDVAVDPNTPHLSTFFINNFQKSWPHVSVHGLLRVALHHFNRNGETKARNLLSKLFPQKK